MESHQAVSIWGRTIRAISPSVNVQSLPRFLAALTHVNAEYRNQGIATQPLLLDCLTAWEVPVSLLSGLCEKAGTSTPSSREFQYAHGINKGLISAFWEWYLK